MVRNREGHTVELSTIKSVEDGGTTWRIQKEDGWTFGVDKSDLGYEPQVGDTVVTKQAVNTIAGIIIEGHVARWWNADKVEADHEQWRKNWRLEKLERYVEHGDALKARAAALVKPLRERMERFETESDDAVEFWIEDAGYEMAALSGADALLRKVLEMDIVIDIDDASQNSDQMNQNAIDWIEDWWNINSDKHDPPYDYAKQMEIVPDFGDGHSGWTASAAKGLAVLILKGEKV